MSKRYLVEDVSWWDTGCGCDCCYEGAYLSEGYNVEELIKEGYGTQPHKEDLYVSLLQLNNLLPEDYWESDNEEDYFSESELFRMLCDNNIKLEYS